MNGSTYPSEEDALLSRRQLSTTTGNRFHVSKAWIHSIFIGTIVLGLLLSALFDDRSSSAVHKSSSYVDQTVDILDQNSDQKQSDTKNPINAHGGGFLFYENVYYWYGEIKIGKTYTPPANANWGGSRVDLVGISCYSSQDLIHWESRGIVLPAVTDDPSHDLYVKGVAERPKVVYNSLTNKFVMWLHIDSMDYVGHRLSLIVVNRIFCHLGYIYFDRNLYIINHYCSV
ncbi:glycosyl hydrolase (family 43) [Skeletonema marinoi]|uniref:Glycosyl hydrolase (Family 43) n=1 Tax=Skeletonema marinoi TaxID=267567 RepID=A0AAD8YHN4_9STRA|nr:glycosyl hydrolase (family 43) [Skeletonema marinoi]